MTMKAYIRSAASVSPQKTFNHAGFLDEPIEYNTNRLACIEPDYNELIAPKLSRRMSRVIKMSVASALQCLKDANVENPDAIVTGTAYGCLEDTGVFLTNMISFDEEPLSPMAFVQSTHNTIGAQISLLLNSHGYNNTFASGGASFENALQDSLMLLAESEANILVGGMDEITDDSHTILSRTGIYKRNPVSNFDLFTLNTKGTIGGEGAAFFLLSNTGAERALACIDGVDTFYKPEGITEITERIAAFLAAQSISLSDIDLLIPGNNGDLRGDAIYKQVQNSLFVGTPSVNYKHLCGEYPTSSAFALWLGANVVNTNTIPAVLGHNFTASKKINRVLIYNHYQNIYHSLILVSAC